MSNEESIAETVKVTAGSPSAAELAAVIAILEAKLSEASSAIKVVQKTASSWNMNGGNLRSDLSPGPGQWQAQYRPGMD
ncbi:MAG: acyl-CoA carboxylase subunit epsilon [Actinomycetes bacterium]